MIKASALITPTLADLIMGIAAKHQPAKKKPGRKSMLEAHAAAVAAGKAPGPLEFQTVNYSYNTHADRIHKLGTAGDVEALRALDLKGTNTYARAIRRYRDLWVEHLDGHA